MKEILEELSAFEGTFISLLKASKTSHLTATTTGRFPEGVEAGVFQGGVTAPGRPPIDVDGVSLESAYAVVFLAARTKGHPLDQLSARAERLDGAKHWVVRVNMFTCADAAKAERARSSVDQLVRAMLEARVTDAGWERLSLTRYGGQTRVIRKYPGKTVEDLAVDATAEDCLRAVDAVYTPFGLRPDYPRWHLLASGGLEVEMSLEPE